MITIRGVGICRAAVLRNQEIHWWAILFGNGEARRVFRAVLTCCRVDPEGKSGNGSAP